MSNINTQPTMNDLLASVKAVDLELGQIVKGEVIFVVKNQVLIKIPNVGVGIIRGKDLYSEEYIADLKVGLEIEAAVVSLDNELGVVELSFKAIGHDKVWKEINAAMESKATVEAKVIGVNRGGFMIKVKSVDGFLPASLLSPTHAIKQVGVEDKSLAHQMKKYLGQIFNVKILNINVDNETIIVSEKSVSDEIVGIRLSNYKIGDVVEGVVAGTVDFGLFVKFDEMLDGLVHISEIAWKKIDDPRKEYKAGDKVTVKIIDIDKDNRINLSIKQTTPNPWYDFIKNAKPGEKFLGKVVKIVSYGAIVVNEATEIQGLCHISQFSEVELESPSKIHELLKIGDTKEFTILSVESDEKLYLTLLPLDIAKKIQEEIVAKMNISEQEVEAEEVENIADTLDAELPEIVELADLSDLIEVSKIEEKPAKAAKKAKLVKEDEEAE